jgi:hypothetical protein
MQFTSTFEDNNIPPFDQIQISLGHGKSTEYVIDAYIFSIFKADVKFLASGSYGNVFSLRFSTGQSVAAKIVTADDYEINLLNGIKENACKQLLPYFIPQETYLQKLKIILLPLMDGTIRELALDEPGISLPQLFNMAILWCKDLQCMVNKHKLYYTDINHTNIMYKKMKKSGNIFVQFVDFGSLIEVGEQPWGVYVLPNRKKRDTVREIDIVWPLLVTLSELYAVQHESVEKVERTVFKMRSTKWTKKNMDNFTSMLPPSLRQLLQDTIDGKLTSLSELQQRCATFAKKRLKRKRRGDDVEVEWKHDSRLGYKSFVGKRYKATLVKQLPRAWIVQWADGSQSQMPKSWIY